MNVFFTFIIFFLPALALSQWQSSLVYYNAQNRLEYKSDTGGNRIPDFSYAGYKNGLEPIPDVAVVKTIAPVSGDNTAHINDAIREISNMEKDANGFRGALLLEAGLYEVQGTIRIPYDGVVLRGVGAEENPAQNTVLFATGNSPLKRTVLVAGGGDDGLWEERVYGTTTDILSDTIRVGERRFVVSDGSLYQVGDNIIIYRPCTEAWLAAIDYGGTHSEDQGAEAGVDVPWTEGSLPTVFNRYITAINGDTLTIDAPLYDHLIRSRAQSNVYTNRRDGIKTQIGIENLRIDIQAASDTDENHAWNALDLYQVEDAWVRNCTFLHFGLSGVRSNTATRVTVENCRALDPCSVVEGGKRYNYNAYTASQLILFKECFARNGRHHFVSNGKSYTSGVVFLDCTSSGAYTSSEGHRRWSQALLYDNLTELDGPRENVNPRLLGLYNRGYYGTSHGWAVTHSVAWNCDLAAGDLIVQKPPTGQNYAIGCSAARITGIKSPAPFDEPQGFIEGSNRTGLQPRSLYLAQLEDRKKDITAVTEHGNPATNPSGFVLGQNYPNPFNPQTTISYELTAPAGVELVIFDARGRRIQTLVRGHQQAGIYSKNWDAAQSASGIYYYRLRVGDGIQIRKMVCIK